MKHRIRNVKRWLARKLAPEYQIPPFLRLGYESKDIVRVMKSMDVDSHSYEFLNSAAGQAKYDAVYGLTREMAEELRPFVKYTESYDEETQTWRLTVALEVVK